MSVAAKICGLSTAEAVAAAVSGGARFVGFIFYPPSPRHVTPEVASVLALGVAPGVSRVGVFVDPADELLAAVLAKVPLDLLQFHGSETPERVEQIKRRFGRPAVGFALFHEVPTLWTLVGAAVVVASTLFITWRETQVARQARRAAAASSDA